MAISGRFGFGDYAESSNVDHSFDGFSFRAKIKPLMKPFASRPPKLVIPRSSSFHSFCVKSQETLEHHQPYGIRVVARPSQNQRTQTQTALNNSYIFIIHSFSPLGYFI